MLESSIVFRCSFTVNFYENLWFCPVGKSYIYHKEDTRGKKECNVWNQEWRGVMLGCG